MGGTKVDRSDYVLAPSKYATVADGYRLPAEKVVIADLKNVERKAEATSMDERLRKAPSQERQNFGKRNTEASRKVLTFASIPKPIRDMEYAVRGAIVARADELKKDLEEHPHKHFNFTEIISANLGNPHAVGQKPITFNRQVLSCLINPSLLSIEQAPFTLPSDVQLRARKYLHAFPSFGAYSPSSGIPLFRDMLAEWFEKRDGFPCSPQSIFLTDGASPAIKVCLELLLQGPTDGILTPIPQYPLYSATITRLNSTAVPYYLDETSGWALRRDELERSLQNAREEGISVKALVVINPGNPTGALLKEELIRDIILFCEKERLVLLADEVYQANIHTDTEAFVSFRKVLKKIESPIELISFHSSSKSVGECGVRGGLMQIENWSPDAMSVLYKLMSVNLCPNTMGQAMVASMTNPPLPGEPSYQSWKTEVDQLNTSLKKKAKMAYETFNSLPNMSCQKINGAMYAFPRIWLPEKALEVAKEKGVAPDMLYCMELLEETGVVCVPGSGFLQFPGTFHFRVTILPVEEKYKVMLSNISTFHIGFMKRYQEAIGK